MPTPMTETETRKCQCAEWGCHNCTPAERVHSHGHNACQEEAVTGSELCYQCEPQSMQRLADDPVFFNNDQDPPDQPEWDGIEYEEEDDPDPNAWELRREERMWAAMER